MIDNSGLEKRIRVSSYDQGQLAMESLMLITVDDDEEWEELQKEVHDDHAREGLTVSIVELTEMEFRVEQFESALDMPEWDEAECPVHLPERISEN